MAIDIVIADDHEIVRIGLKVALEAAGFRIVAEARNGAEAIKAVKRYRPSIALIEVRLPESDGITCLTRIKLDYPDTQVLMYSGHDNPTYMARSAALGAAGYISKSSPVKQLIEALRTASRGESLWSREALKRVSGELIHSANGPLADAQLTKREREVLQQLAHGLTNKEIALSLEISYETVKEHVQHILRKLGVTDRTQAAVWAVRHQLV